MEIDDFGLYDLYVDVVDPSETGALATAIRYEPSHVNRKAGVIGWAQVNSEQIRRIVYALCKTGIGFDWTATDAPSPS